MNVIVTLTKNYTFLDQVRREYQLARGSQLTGQLSLTPSVGPFGIVEMEHSYHPAKLAVGFSFEHLGKRLNYKATIDSRRLWPPNGSPVRLADEGVLPNVGPVGGMRDDRDSYYYILPDGSERKFFLKYVGFTCWLTMRPERLAVKLRHFCSNTPPDDHPVVYYAISIESLLFHPELKLSYDKDGFIEDYNEAPYVRMEDA